MDVSQPFLVGEWLVEPDLETIRNGDRVVKLEPRVMDLLVYLARHPGQVISRDELENDVWKGMVVGYDALTSAMIKLCKAFGDSSRHPRIIQTVSKRGYRLIATVKPAPAHHLVAPKAYCDFQSRHWLGSSILLLVIRCNPWTGYWFTWKY